MKPAIVIAAYNRSAPLKRLLRSIAEANYNQLTHIPLVISIDKHNGDDVYNIADEFNWPNGLKKIIAHEKHLGLRQHIISCADLTEEYGSIILLEDDLYVSPYFYKYASDALNYYQEDDMIAGISLYNYRFNETARRYFEPISDGYDIYFVQIVSSWGQAWTFKQWLSFKSWYESDKAFICSQDKLPSNVIAWPESSWKKYFIKYMVDRNKFFVYPRISLTTNFGDIGTHHKNNKHHLQVPLLLGEKIFSFTSIEDTLAVYDSFFEILNEKVIFLNKELNKYKPEIDLYGTKELDKIDKQYIITSKLCSKEIKSFTNILKPHESSIINNISGDGFVLADIKHVIENKRPEIIDYIGIDLDYISIKVLFVLIIRRIKRKVYRKNVMN